MLRIDGRAGSASLYEALKSRGVDAELVRLAAGDIEMVGDGPEGPALVGIEFKTTHDLLQCFADKRFVDNQLPAMREQFTVPWLLVEGPVKCGEAGELLVWRAGQWVIPGVCRTFQTWSQWLLGLTLRGRVLVHHTGNRNTTLEWITAWHKNWLAPWSSHKSHTGFMDPLHALPATQIEPVTLCQRFAALLPGVGPGKSKAVAERFGTIHNAAVADVDAWEQVDGIGRKGAVKIVRAVWEAK